VPPQRGGWRARCPCRWSAGLHSWQLLLRLHGRSLSASVAVDGVVWCMTLDSSHLFVKPPALIDVSLRDRHQALGQLGLGACEQRVAALLGGELAQGDRGRL